MLPPTYYANFQIFQSRDVVIISHELMHDVRMVYLDGRAHPPASIEYMAGHSRGRWEGDTLVVDTTNFNGDQIRMAVQAAPGRGLFMVESLGAKDRLQGPSQDLHVIERFTRVADDAINYEFTVSDPLTWTKPWTAMVPWTKIDPKEQMYEYMCHEDNFDIVHLLSGARAREKNPALNLQQPTKTR
jgi:hypothetical protein